MSFPPSFLEELRARLPLSDVVGKRLRLTRAGREYKGCCPFHNEKTPSFYINDAKQFYHCFGCGAHGDVIGFTMRHDRLSFPEAIEALAAEAGLAVPVDAPLDREKFDQEKRLYQLLERTTAWFAEQLFAPGGREALAYLQKRGLSEEALRRFQLGYAPHDGQALIRKLLNEGYKMDELVSVGLAKQSEERKEYYSFFRNRVMFPVGDRRGRTVAFGGRVMGEGEPKYLNSPDHPLFHKGKLLYGLSRARTAVSQNQAVIVVEGYMDVIALVEAGFSGAVAPLGTALTEDQMMALWKLLPPLDARDPSRDFSPVLCFDGDNAGLRAALRSVERALPILSPAQTFRVAFMPEGQDPDELLAKSGKLAMDAVLHQAKPMIDVMWEMTLAGRRLSTPEERATFSAALKQRVNNIAHDELRQLYHDEIQKRLSALFFPRQQATGPNRSQYASNRGRDGTSRHPSWSLSSSAPTPMINRKQPQNVHYLRERAFLALMLNHPSLFHDFGEDFAQITFHNKNFETLRQQIVDVLSGESQESLDATDLNRLLCGTASTNITTNQGSVDLKEVLSESTYMHAGYARPDQPIEVAREGWKSLWSNQLLDKLQLELKVAKLRYVDESSEENYSRLMALRREVELMGQETGNSIVAETNFPLIGQE